MSLRTRALIAGAAVAATVAGSVSAATIVGTGASETLRGTARADVIRGGAGNDSIFGLGGADLLDGGLGADRITGGPGDDRVQTEDGRSDVISCGPGRDLVAADPVDRVGGDCELVARRISTDPFRGDGGQHETAAEPDSFAFGSTVVTAFQVGRFFAGGASTIGFATSVDGGRTWRSGFLPELTVISSPPGTAVRASDPSVAYDATHGVWLITSLVITTSSDMIVVSRSADGLTWSAPAAVAAAPGFRSLPYDKEWIGCDNGPDSAFRGNCYVVYSDLVAHHISTQTSRDGGFSWSASVGSADGADGLGAQPVVRPNGDLVIPFVSGRELAAIRSTTGATGFSRKTLISDIRFHRPVGMRAPPIPSADVAADGTIYAVWPDCRFHARCSADDIVVSVSRDGVTWSPPARVPIGSVKSRVDLIIPGLALDPASSGAGSRLALAYYSIPAGTCGFSTCRLGAGFIASTNGGATWSRPRPLGPQRMRLTWIAATSSGRMVGDYISTSFADGRAVPVFVLARARTPRFHQAIFAATTALPPG